MTGKILILAILSTLGSLVSADDSTTKMDNVEALRQQGYSVVSITPVFSQLVKFSFPKGFVPVFENAKEGQYIQESVLEGENIQKWSQMITITGAKGLAVNPNVTPARFAGGMAGGFKRTCPDSYHAAYNMPGFGDIKIGSHDAFVVNISCGTVNTMPSPYSESLLLIVIKGQRDYYTIQWAERGAASKIPIRSDGSKWADRLKKLAPIKLCPIAPGEKAPYPSCANSA